jgi:hypothetical protein
MENHSNWKGGKTIDKNGYIFIRHNGKYIYEHRLLMEKKLGRKLFTNEHVHHINEIKDDNRIENLNVLTNSDHQKLHNVHKANGWAKNYDCCIRCGINDKRHWSKGFCQNCYRWSRKNVTTSPQI